MVCDEGKLIEKRSNCPDSSFKFQVPQKLKLENQESQYTCTQTSLYIQHKYWNTRSLYVLKSSIDNTIY